MSLLSRTIQGALAAGILLAALPQVSSAQFGKLKQLKNSISPDSAAKVASALKDSIALAEKLAAGDTTPLQRSKFSRAVSAAGSAANKFEQVTGVSAKDAALAATGLGAGNLLAKKLGVDPMSIGAHAMNQAKAQRAQGMLGGGLSPRMTTVPGMPNVGDLMKMQQSASAGMSGIARAPSNPRTTGDPNAMLGYSEADARAMMLFQQEMMQVALAANEGDLAAQARLESWEVIALKYQPEIERLSLAAHAGDYTTVKRLQEIQFAMMREFAGSGPTKIEKPAKAEKAAKVAKPAKVVKP